jgi:hypothetical protein
MQAAIKKKDHDSSFAARLLGVGAFGLLFSVVDGVGIIGRSVDKFNHKYGFAGLHITRTYGAGHRAP